MGNRPRKNRRLFAFAALLIGAVGVWCGVSMLSWRAWVRECNEAEGLRHLGIVVKMYANEARGGCYPPLSPVSGRLTLQMNAVCPEYLKKPRLLISRADPNWRKKWPPDTPPEFFSDNSSYFYLPYAVWDDDDVQDFAEAYQERVGKGLAFDEDLMAGDPAYTLGRLGEYFRGGPYTESLCDPRFGGPSSARRWRSYSDIPIMIERPHWYPGPLGLRIGPRLRIPLSRSRQGGMVLYKDGRTQFLPYPSKWPMTERTITTLEALSKGEQPPRFDPPPPLPIATPVDLPSSDTDSPWDRTMPGRVLPEVSIYAQDLHEAWMSMYNDYFIRTALASPDPPPEGTFAYRKENVRVRDLLNALCNKYRMRWEQDPARGVIWLLPRQGAQDALLSRSIEAKNDVLAAPFSSGLTQAWSRLHPSPIRGYSHFDDDVSRLDYVSLCELDGHRAYNAAVSIGKGRYSLRELLSICAAHDPALLIHKKVLHFGNTDAILPQVYVVRRRPTQPALGSLWQANFGNSDGNAPSLDAVKQGLASPSLRKRLAARSYLELSDIPWWEPEYGRFVKTSSEENQRNLWFAVGVTDIVLRQQWLRRIEDDSHPTHDGRWLTHVNDSLMALLTEEYIQTGPPGLVLLAVLGLYETEPLCPEAAVGRESEHISDRAMRVREIVRAVEKRGFTPEELRGFEFEVARLMQFDENVRNMLSGYPDLRTRLQELLESGRHIDCSVHERLENGRPEHFIPTGGWGLELLPRSSLERSFQGE